MKSNKITIAICLSFMLPVASSNSETYHTIIHKNDYILKESTLIPTPDTQINAFAENKDTNQTDSGDLSLSNLELDVENGELIEMSTDIFDNESDGRSLSGQWTSNRPLTFISNTKNSVSFYAPNYDGTYYVDLELDDGVYTRSYRGLNLNSEFWTVGETLYGEWQIVNVDQDWSPLASTAFENETITQTKITDQERTRQETEERTSTGDVRFPNSETIERMDDVEETRDVTGTIEYWEITDVKEVTPWTVTEVFVDWTPSASGVYENEMVSQYREIKKERTVQDQELRPFNNNVRTIGQVYTDVTLTTEYRDIQGELEYWTNTGTPVCTAWILDRYDPWLPDASNTNRDETLEQTRTKYESRECTGEQTRPATGDTRSADSEIEYRSENESQTVYGSKIDLNDWFTNDTSGDWAVSNDGSYVYQGINGSPTVFESAADTYGNTVIAGKMRVRSGAGDNDWIGMALGRTDSDNYHLWSWKNGANTGSTEKEGHNFAKVTANSSVNWAMDVSKAGYQILDTLHGDYGWNHGIYYSFEIIYTPTNVKIYVDGSKVIDANGAFSTGKIGFFNLSQGQVEYYKVTDTPIN